MSETNTNRLQWTDKDWATYLGCPIDKIQEYKNILDKNYLMAIERDKNSGKYFMAVYRYDIAPSGFQRLQLLLSGNKRFDNVVNALQDANRIISHMELNDFYAKQLNMPKQAIQMMLIREN